jgi:single-strand DNA-binding protein
MSFNKITIVGNLGRDPELRYTPQGHAVASFSLATNEKRRDKSGELQDVTTWFKITLWRNQAENATKYLTKGSPVYIEGRLRIEEWTDRDGNNRYTLDVQATDMQFIGSRSDGDGGGSWESRSSGSGQQEFPTHSGGGPTPETTSPAGSGHTPSPIDDDDIPF